MEVIQEIKQLLTYARSARTEMYIDYIDTISEKVEDLEKELKPEEILFTEIKQTSDYLRDESDNIT